MSPADLADHIAIETLQKIPDALRADFLNADRSLDHLSPDAFLAVHEAGARDLADSIFLVVDEEVNGGRIETEAAIEDHLRVAATRFIATLDVELSKHRIIRSEWIDSGAIAAVRAFRTRIDALFMTTMGGAA